MALINCPECGKEISDRAKACPHCGAPLRIKKQKSEKSNRQKIVNKVILIVAIFVISAALVTGYLLWQNRIQKEKNREEWQNSENGRKMAFLQSELEERGIYNFDD